jgi:phenylpyruvate tautomerase PptA (4-oxalocrotonate tautomerase family)
MPVIEMYVPKGALDDETRRTLHDRVSRQVLEAEGATYDESPLAQAITWMMIYEMPEGGWSIGGKVLSSGEEPRVLTRVSVPHGALDDERRADIAARVNREVTNALGEPFKDPTTSFCLISEQTFSGGGIVVSFADLVQWLGLPHRQDRDANAAEPIAAGGTPR